MKLKKGIVLFEGANRIEEEIIAVDVEHVKYIRIWPRTSTATLLTSDQQFEVKGDQLQILSTLGWCE